MAKTADPGWEAFERALHDHPARVRDLAAVLGQASVTITEWKTGRRRPSFDLLPAISVALFNNPTTLASRMGLIPADEAIAEEMIVLSEKIAELSQTYQRLDAAVREVPEDATARVVAAAINTGRWAVGVWPAYEGPVGYEIRAADRLDFTRTDGGETDENSLRADIGSMLNYANAQRTGKPIPRPRLLSEHEGDSHTVERWSVPRFNRDEAPRVDGPHPRARSIAVVSTIVRAWPSDVAASMAKILGYGTLAPRNLTKAIRTGRTTDDSELETRLRFHERLMRHPRDSYVWFHYAVTADPSELIPTVLPPDPLVIVRLRETDALLDDWIGARELGSEADAIHRARDSLDRQVAAQTSERVIEIEMDQPRAADGGDLPTIELRNRRMGAAFEAAGQAIGTMLERGLLDVADIDDWVATIEPHPDRAVVLGYLREKAGVSW
jgi:transcriptional regulator with XRE-family HTH domain